MPGQPTLAQLILLMVAVAVFGVGGVASLRRLRGDTPAAAALRRLGLWGGIAVALVVLIWHSYTRGSWTPIGDNFDALIWLALLLALFVAYTQRARPLSALDWFIMPLVLLLLVGAAHFGASPRHYHAYGHNIWLWVHSATAYGGTVAFAVAAASGAMYLLAAARLRRKQPASTLFGSLERLEHTSMVWVTLGFALLSVGVITGIVRWLEPGMRIPIGKVLLSGLAWLVYAVVLHVPINPRFRGRKAAALSIFGFALIVATLLAVQVFGGRL